MSGDGDFLGQGILIFDGLYVRVVVGGCVVGTGFGACGVVRRNRLIGRWLLGICVRYCCWGIGCVVRCRWVVVISCSLVLLLFMFIVG